MLRGWKEICEYTKYSRTSLLRFIKSDDFPILRGSYRKVWSSRTLIDVWLATKMKEKKDRASKPENIQSLRTPQ
jgi:hypothetical protein